jgi:tetratricopeptide (TPR) repeat protein
MDAPPPELQAALAFWQQGRAGQALASVQQAIRQHPSLPEPWEMAGYFLVNRKKWAEARNLLALAVDLFPERALLHAYYALALDKTGDAAAGFDHTDRALGLAPALTEALLTRVEILFDAGYYDLALLESAALADKNIPETAAFCQGAAAFLTGDLSRGMKLLAAATKSGWRGRELPEWDGKPTEKSIVVYNGQGFGDLIQFARYLERAEQNAAKIYLQIPPAMERLMRDSFPGLPLVADDADLPGDAAFRCPLSSLAAAPEGGFDAMAHRVPYLRADPERVAAWRDRLSGIPRPRSGPKIGVVWTSPWQMNSPFRTVDFAALKPLIDVAGQHLVSLQMGAEAGQAAGSGLFDAAPFIKDFADSAALMSELDLVISLDSAPAHLAGALGRPVWVFLPFSAEWRWLVAREDCIWYPTMRLFRQPEPRGWETVFAAIAADLGAFLSGDARVLQPRKGQGAPPRRHPNAIPLPGINKNA